jgi:endo-1,4-beta-xylanase
MLRCGAGFAGAMAMLLVLASCATKPVESMPPDSASLRDTATFPVGAALNPDKLRNHRAYRATVMRHFDSITAENMMKMHRLRPARDAYDWMEAEYLITFARQNGMRVHGHTLLWHQAVPDWVEDFEGTSDEWEAMVKEHVQTVVSHFRGSVAGWDVVNEAFEDDGTLRDTIWRRHLGDDYVATVFQWAREADPEARLFYNDYDLAVHPAKLQAVLAMVDSFKQRGITIDGVGMQLHTELSHPSIEEIRKAAQAVADRGLLVHFSELDVRGNPWPGSGPIRYTTYTSEFAAAQRDRVRDIVRVFQNLPEASRYGITTWGVSDVDSWFRSYVKIMDWPLLFDEDYEPKEAFRGFVEGLSAD